MAVIKGMNMTIGSPTFDQLKVFLAIVEEAGFSAAARRLNRRQSAISYAIANLEEQLGGLPLFDRTGRRPTLTGAGKAVLANARTIALGYDELRACARDLHLGVEAEVTIVVDVMMPNQQLIDALADFRAKFPAIALRITIDALGSVPALVLNGTCTIGISGPLFYSVDGLEQSRIGSISLVPVASQDHVLAQMEGPISNEIASRHTQLVLSDRSRLSEGQDFAVVAKNTWRISDLRVKHELLLAGIGWGNMPKPMIERDLANGRLTRLPLAQGHDRPYPLYAIHRVQNRPGPAARWLIERITDGAS